jgi:hypothetical protein
MRGEQQHGPGGASNDDSAAIELELVSSLACSMTCNFKFFVAFNPHCCDSLSSKGFAKSCVAPLIPYHQRVVTFVSLLSRREDARLWQHLADLHTLSMKNKEKETPVTFV